MKTSATIKNNYEFRRLYAKGKSAASPYIVVYCRRNRKPYSRVGFTVGSKVGKAVTRNLVRRRLREAYRRSEELFVRGYDIVIVARTRSPLASYAELRRDMLDLFEKLGMRSPETNAHGETVKTTPPAKGPAEETQLRADGGQA